MLMCGPYVLRQARLLLEENTNLSPTTLVLRVLLTYWVPLLIVEEHTRVSPISCRIC